MRGAFPGRTEKVMPQRGQLAAGESRPSSEWQENRTTEWDLSRYGTFFDLAELINYLFSLPVPDLYHIAIHSGGGEGVPLSIVPDDSAPMTFLPRPLPLLLSIALISLTSLISKRGEGVSLFCLSPKIPPPRSPSFPNPLPLPLPIALISFTSLISKRGEGVSLPPERPRAESSVVDPAP